MNDDTLSAWAWASSTELSRLLPALKNKMNAPAVSCHLDPQLLQMICCIDTNALHEAMCLFWLLICFVQHDYVEHAVSLTKYPHGSKSYAFHYVGNPKSRHSMQQLHCGCVGACSPAKIGTLAFSAKARASCFRLNSRIVSDLGPKKAMPAPSHMSTNSALSLRKP